MRSKKEIEDEISSIRNQLKTINSTEIKKTYKNEESNNSEEFSSLFKYILDENKKTTLVLDTILQRLDKLESDLNDMYADDEEEEEEEEPIKQPIKSNYIEEPKKEILLADTDVKILQILQLSENGMSSADEISKKMNYKGKNAASARLNKLYKIGLVDRYQLGHKVYYKYDAGKTTNTLIVSPPQYWGTFLGPSYF